MSQEQTAHPIGEFTAAALRGLRALVDVNTVIGDPITTAEGVVIIPVSKVSFGYGTGGSDLPSAKSDNLFGGATTGGVTIQPLAFLVVSGSKVELLHLQTASSTNDRIVNTIPVLFDKVVALFQKDEQAEPAPPDAL